jgi:GNAT superfamily N-acetyltransferase
MIDKIKISKADSGDLPDILGLQKSAFLSEAEIYNDYNLEPLTQTLESIEADFRSYIFLKAVFNNKIVGSVKGRETGEFCWIGRLIVDPGFQNKGIGKMLMRAIEDQFPATKMYLLCTGFKSIKNIKLYESLNYKISEESYDEKNLGVKLVKMVKKNII